MKKSDGPLPALAFGIVVAIALATVLVDGGWFLWLPALLALGVTTWIGNAIGR